jgi:protein SCO1/2
MRRFLLAATLCLILGVLGALIALAAEPSPAPARNRFVPPREAAFDFHLRDQDGRVASIASARGKVLAITFLYSTCHDLCPAEANLIGAAAKRAGPGVLVYSVSVDPAGDTTARVRAFIKRRGLDPASFKFLICSHAELAPVWQAYGIAPINATPKEALAAARQTDEYLRAFAAAAAKATGPPPKRRPYEPPQRDAPAAAGDAYPDPGDLSYRGRVRHEAGVDFEHSAYVMVIDKHGIQRVGIPFEQLDVPGLTSDFKALLRER